MHFRITCEELHRHLLYANFQIHCNNCCSCKLFLKTDTDQILCYRLIYLISYVCSATELCTFVSLFTSLHWTSRLSPPTALSWPPEDGYVRMFLRGRPVTMHLPDQQRESYSLDYKGALPDRKLKLQWVYPSDRRGTLMKLWMNE